MTSLTEGDAGCASCSAEGPSIGARSKERSCGIGSVTGDPGSAVPLSPRQRLSASRYASRQKSDDKVEHSAPHLAPLFRAGTAHAGRFALGAGDPAVRGGLDFREEVNGARR
jgi:hypothetical protein